MLHLCCHKFQSCILCLNFSSQDSLENIKFLYLFFLLLLLFFVFIFRVLIHVQRNTEGIKFQNTILSDVNILYTITLNIGVNHYSKYWGNFNQLKPKLFKHQKADDKIYISKFSKIVRSKLNQSENSETRGQTV